MPHFKGAKQRSTILPCAQKMESQKCVEKNIMITTNLPPRERKRMQVRSLLVILGCSTNLPSLVHPSYVLSMFRGGWGDIVLIYQFNKC